MRVFIPTAGTGSRLGEMTKYLNKSLISINNKPIISHIIEHYPDDVEFVIALGYKGNFVRDYLELAYPEKKFIFVEIDKYEGEGSGLGYTLLRCKEHLQQPFIFHSCDTLVGDMIPEPTENWMGYSDFRDLEQYRTINIHTNEVISIHEKGWEHLENNRPYIGLAGIYNYHWFWEEMERGKNTSILEGEVYALKYMLSTKIKALHFSWCDTGNLKSLKFTRDVLQLSNSPNILEKSDEAIWFVNGKVIKFSNDQKFIENRVKRAELINEYVPKITGSRTNMYSYDMVEGEILSKIITIPLFRKLLTHTKRFWKSNNTSCNEYKEFKTICMNFYRNKTYERVEMFYRKFGIEDNEEIINDISVPKLKELLDDIDWEKLSEGRDGRFHGDFHFENILYNEKDDKFIFLDWRQDFGGNLEIGDIYYDLAKLNHGLIVCHELISKNMFSIKIEGNKIEYEFYRKQILVECEKYLGDWLKYNGVNSKKVRIMTALIYLNIAALHHDPYCKLLYYLGKYMLYNEEYGIS